MKKFSAFILAVSILLLAGCGNKGEITDLGFVNPETGIEYVYCTPMGLYPVDPSDEFITVVNPDKTKTVFHGVWFEDTSDFLCYEEEGYYFLVRNKDVAEPTVKEFNPIAAAIYNSSNTGYITSFYADNQYLPEDKQEHNPTEDTWLCQMIGEYLAAGENVEVPVTDKTIQDLFYFRLYSEDYPGLYYLVSFFGYNGRYFLRDSAHNTTVYCPRDIILRMVGE